MTLFIKEATNEEPIQTLETVLMQMDGIERALVDTKDGEVKITYHESQISEEEITGTIQKRFVIYG
ncbi:MULTISPECIES: heavy-metal-associated domain-containing protein [Salipaludibacillus]|nr:heavy-metal-associated domain-containing protein [Salipaludibacillus neizhouensis]